MEEKMVLVDKEDRKMGEAEKMEVHKKGMLHRAFSIFIFNKKDQLLLQKRAQNKYHSAGLWSNTCCSHPQPGESVLEAAHRRLKQEMGFDCNLKEVFSFVYQKTFENGLTEYEYDHVLFGFFNGKPDPNSKEVEHFKWITLGQLREDINENPENYTYWFKKALPKIEEVTA